eukprot:CAMPEP_0182893248 /NCGR_PEP_ID=MMETSP0034_2-20130328/24364_1 /TAXON_ID=156128 /ORGANISM="Nephroselmis pyriformis, Strain CCMP717" /LENGTH=57 /DNA_ID=CAMNT_0025026981 /DNA_START=1 /DNA_END=171 /DNA_ORIENTATION=+
MTYFDMEPGVELASKGSLSARPHLTPFASAAAGGLGAPPGMGTENEPPSQAGCRGDG